MCRLALHLKRVLHFKALFFCFHTTTCNWYENVFNGSPVQPPVTEGTLSSLLL